MAMLQRLLKFGRGSDVGAVNPDDHYEDEEREVLRQRSEAILGRLDARKRRARQAEMQRRAEQQAELRTSQARAGEGATDRFQPVVQSEPGEIDGDAYDVLSHGDEDLPPASELVADVEPSDRGPLEEHDARDVEADRDVTAFDDSDAVADAPEETASADTGTIDYHASSPDDDFLEEEPVLPNEPQDFVSDGDMEVREGFVEEDTTGGNDDETTAFRPMEDSETPIEDQQPGEGAGHQPLFGGQQETAGTAARSDIDSVADTDEEAALLRRKAEEARARIAKRLRHDGVNEETPRADLGEDVPPVDYDPPRD